MVFSYTSPPNVVSISALVGVAEPVLPPNSRPTAGSLSIPTIVNFKGMAYPLSKIYILKDGQVATTTTADKFANFSVSLMGLNTNTYTFSVYSEDSSKRKSSFFSFPLFITSGTTVNISNIFLSPTIDVNKIEVKKGDNLIIFGQSNPNNEVSISVRLNREYLYKVFSNTMGAYLYNLNTSLLEVGKYQSKSRSTINGQTSLYNTPISFSVSDKNILKDTEACSTLRGDLNCDNRVNLIDFSIMAYWYNKINPPQKVDLNGDNKINLVDFSIMVFNWTG